MTMATMFLNNQMILAIMYTCPVQYVLNLCQSI
jgi:hypothetical protein